MRVSIACNNRVISSVVPPGKPIRQKVSKNSATRANEGRGDFSEGSKGDHGCIGNRFIFLNLAMHLPLIPWTGDMIFGFIPENIDVVST